jgi:hypothetical protein
MITYFSIEGRDPAKDYKDFIDQIDLNIEGNYSGLLEALKTRKKLVTVEL